MGKERRVVVTGLGLLTPTGRGASASWAGLLGATATAAAPIVSFDASALPVRIAATVPDQLPGPATDHTHSRRSLPRFIQFALDAADEALRDADWDPRQSQQAAESTGVSIGVGMSSLDDIFNASSSILTHPRGHRSVSPHFVPRILTNMAAGHVSIQHSLQGPNTAPSTACAAGAHAVAEAARLIERGDADVMVCGGSEACIHQVAIAGFSRARALATSFNDNPTEASRPFDNSREGFVMGEGAGILVLEEASHARKRGASIYAEVLGTGFSGDAHHITAPSPNGYGATLAMSRALRDAALEAHQINYINAHATSTPRGDEIELRALDTIFSNVHSNGPAIVSSTKGIMGHLLGASGSVEAAVAVMAVANDRIPPNVNLVDSEVLLKSKALELAGSRPTEKEVKFAMSNSFGFGGTNVSLVFGSA